MKNYFHYNKASKTVQKKIVLMNKKAPKYQIYMKLNKKIILKKKT